MFFDFLVRPTSTSKKRPRKTRKNFGETIRQDKIHGKRKGPGEGPKKKEKLTKEKGKKKHKDKGKDFFGVGVLFEKKKRRKFGDPGRKERDRGEPKESTGDRRNGVASPCEKRVHTHWGGSKKAKKGESFH